MRKSLRSLPEKFIHNWDFSFSIDLENQNHSKFKMQSLFMERRKRKTGFALSRTQNHKRYKTIQMSSEIAEIILWELKMEWM